MKKKEVKPYNVITWNINSGSIEYYDVMPYLIEKYEKDKKSKSMYAKHPKTFDEFKQFILDESKYQFWSRCQYEVIISSWPARAKRNEDGSVKTYEYTSYLPEKQVMQTVDFYDQKIDVYQQIEMNIDIITQHFMNNVM